MKLVPLGELADINPSKERVPASSRVSFVGMSDLDSAKAEARPRGEMRIEDVAAGLTQFRNNDILAAKISPCWENGKIGQAHLPTAVGFGSTEFHVLRPSTHLDARYLLHALRQPDVRATGTLRMTGSAGQRRVPVKYFQDLKIPMLPIEEQRRIAAILDHAADLSAKRRKVLVGLEALPASIFDRDFATGNAPIVALSEIATVTSGITKGRRTSSPVKSIPYLAVSNVQAGSLRLDVVKKIDVTDVEIERYQLRTGDLVLTEGGDPDKLGRGTVWRGELDQCIHQNHVFRVRVNCAHDVNPEFLAAFTASTGARRYFRRAAKQTTGIASINSTQLKALPVAVPDPHRQTAFVDALRRINSRVAIARDAVTVSDALFAALQSRAFRGEL